MTTRTSTNKMMMMHSHYLPLFIVVGAMAILLCTTLGSRSSADLETCSTCPGTDHIKEASIIVKNSSSYWSYSALPSKRLGGRSQPNTNSSCPTLQGSRAIFVFYHVSKTGGTTVRHLFDEIAKNDSALFFDWKHSDLKQVDPVIQTWLTADQVERNHLLIEFHSIGSRSLESDLRKIQKWRRLEKSRRKARLFIFTVVREPVSLLVSAFNFYQVKRNHDKATEENLQRFSIFDPQCRFFAGVGWKGPDATASQLNGTKACPPIAEKIRENFDWVGDMSTLNTETLPLLTKLLVDEPSLGRDFGSFNSVTKASTLRLESLSDETREILEERVTADQAFHQSVLGGYAMDPEFKRRCL